MFSPAIRVFSQENSETAPKKPGAASAVKRRPFLDRAVNAKSPDVRTLKAEPCKKTPQPKLEKQLLEPPKLHHEDDDLFIYDSYSFKEFEENYMDINFFCGKSSLNIHRSFYNGSPTPPPKLDLDIDMFIKMPESDFFIANEPFDQLLDESVEEASLPQIEFD